MSNKASDLRRMLFSDQIEFVIEAHNAMSALIAQEAGFKAIWAGSLCISAALGVRDNNEASWTQILETVEFISDATKIPILLDADTGYGNFNNVRRLVRKLEQRDVAGMCIEDKLFPKTNSFINSETQPLANLDEFCGKIKAAKDSQNNSDFCVVARTEALIVGEALSEALKRAEAYHKAGADALLIHSKRKDANQIVEFMNEWAGLCPIVIVPTTYITTPLQVFVDLDISVFIFANHMLRASVAAMQKVAKEIYDKKSIQSVADDLVSVQEIFRLQNADELKLAESKYLPNN